MSLEESETEEKQTTGQPWHTKATATGKVTNSKCKGCP